MDALLSTSFNIFYHMLSLFLHDFEFVSQTQFSLVSITAVLLNLVKGSLCICTDSD